MKLSGVSKLEEKQAELLGLPHTRYFTNNSAGMRYLTDLAVVALHKKDCQPIKSDIEYFEAIRLEEYDDPSIDGMQAAFEAFDNYSRPDSSECWHLLHLIDLAEEIKNTID